ncbi:unnamed protein product [Urochloa decumbens]|uniref:Uncharacterized protein n=1 Tax=Urochloa decumbens TaxID=240449 RepID=A0ABC8YHJ7_9POAL
MPTLTSNSIASPRWGVPFCGVRSSGATRTRRPPPSSGHGGCGWPLDRVAGWVGGGIAAVFFASLERCSCVNVRTQDDDLLDDEQRDSEAPLMFDDGNDDGDSTAGHAGVERRRGSRRGDKGKRSGRGGAMGCYGEF